MSVESLITQHIDVWTSAVQTKSTAGRGTSSKLDLYGIKKLRELILELAVRGKLVPQDPNDEPASVLLEKISKQKKLLIKEKKIKSIKKLPDIIDSETPYAIPQSWQWVRFGEAVFNRDAERIPLSVDERKTRQGNYDYYGASGVIDSIDDFLFDKPLLLIGEDGANLVSRSTPIAFMARGKYWVNNHAHVLDGITEQFLLYVGLHINAISLLPYITGTAQPKMNQAKMNTILLALPPEKEQHRIVAKVDELMQLCDQLEQQTEASIAAHQVLVETLLTTLTNSKNAEELMENWQRISAHFDTLFTTEESIDQLKQTILQLAVMGKLVPQNPADEPASELLKRIAKEKAQLVKDKVYQKTSRLLDKHDIRYPVGWEPVQIGELCPSIVPNRDKPKTFTGNIPWVTLPAFPKEGWYLDKEGVELCLSDKEIEIYSARLIPKNSVLMSCVGRFGLTAINSEPVSSNQQIHAFVVLSGLVPEYLSMVIRVAGKDLEATASATTIAYLNKTKCESIQFGLPPLREQHHIVNKVEELSVVCEQLKQAIWHNHQIQLQLTDAIVGEAI